MLDATREVIGLAAAIERFLADADERGNSFLVTALAKQLTRLKGLLERHIVSGTIWLWSKMDSDHLTF